MGSKYEKEEEISNKRGRGRVSLSATLTNAVAVLRGVCVGLNCVRSLKEAKPHPAPLFPAAVQVPFNLHLPRDRPR